MLPEFSIYFNFTLKSQENLIPTYNHGELKHRKTSKQTLRPLLLPTAQSFWAPCQTASAATTLNLLPRAWQACKAVLTPWESCSFLNSTEGVCAAMLLVFVLKDEGTARASFSMQSEPSRYYHCQRADKLKPTVLNTTNLKHAIIHLLSVSLLSVHTILSFRFQIWAFQYAVYGRMVKVKLSWVLTTSNLKSRRTTEQETAGNLNFFCCFFNYLFIVTKNKVTKYLQILFIYCLFTSAFESKLDLYLKKV